MIVDLFFTGLSLSIILLVAFLFMRDRSGYSSVKRIRVIKDRELVHFSEGTENVSVSVSRGTLNVLFHSDKSEYNLGP